MLVTLYNLRIENGVKIWYYMGAGRKGDSDVHRKSGKTNTLNRFSKNKARTKPILRKDEQIESCKVSA